MASISTVSPTYFHYLLSVDTPQMAQDMTLVLVEKDHTNKKRELWLVPNKGLQFFAKKANWSWKVQIKHNDIKKFFTEVFLPVGYPKTVTPDYLQYQVLNAAQAFCNSLASLLASRAVLEGIGVGDSSATATRAMLLSVMQDAFGRITTIVGAYYLGTRLVPEAKTYRFLADVLNDLAVILDMFSPVIDKVFFPGARILGLCLSAALRALCGIVAGGSKAAITLHFATPPDRKGDLGDLNAKDSSKETVLALVGMLLGGLIIPFMTSPWATYSLLFILVALHLVINYFAVRGLSLRRLNLQRIAIAWQLYKNNKKAPTPQQVAKYESILDRLGTIRDPETQRIIGRCHIGSAPLDVLRGQTLSFSFLQIFHGKYILCFDPRTPFSSSNPIQHPNSYPILHICYQEKFTDEDRFDAWLHAVELCRYIASEKPVDLADPSAQVELIKTTYKEVAPSKVVSAFEYELRNVGWQTGDKYLTPAFRPKALLTAMALTTDKRPMML